MLKSTKTFLIRHHQTGEAMSFSTQKGEVVIEKDGPITVIHTERDDLFSKQLKVIIRKQIEIELDFKNVVLHENYEGFVFDNKVYFRVGERYLGLGPKYLNGKLNIHKAGIC